MTGMTGNTPTNALLFPFKHFKGVPALLTGLLAITVTALLGARIDLSTAGVLSLSFAEPGIRTTMPVLLGQGLVNWLSLSLCLLLAAHWLSPGRYSALDLIATQAAARWPLLLSALYLSFPPAGERIRQLTEDLVGAMPSEPGQVMADATYMGDAFVLTLLGLPLLAFLGWMVWLMFHGFRSTTRLSIHQALVSFLVALTISHFFSRWIGGV